MKKRLLILLFVFGIWLASALSFSAFAQGGNVPNVTGWLFGGSTDELLVGCPLPGDDYPCGGIGWIRPDVPGDGLFIPPADGDVEGFAWASTGGRTGMGWIDFQAGWLRPCLAPCAIPLDWPKWSARREGDNLTGWARIKSIETALAEGNSGGWEGWIKLASVPSDPIQYGVTIDPDGSLCTNNVNGGKCYGWSNELGWIDFSRATTSVVPPPPCTLTASPDTGSAPLSGTIEWATNAQTSCSPSSSPPDSNWNDAGPEIMSNLSGGTTAYGPINQSTTYSLTCTSSLPGNTVCSTNVTINNTGLIASCSGTTDNSNPFIINWSGAGNGGTAPYTYSWSLPGGTPSSGSGPNISSTYLPPPGQRRATLTVTDSSSETATQDCFADAGKKGILHEILPFF